MNDRSHGFDHAHRRVGLKDIPTHVDANGAALDETVLENLMDALAQGEDVPLWLQVRETSVRVAPISSDEVPRRFEFVPDPQARAGENACC